MSKRELWISKSIDWTLRDKSTPENGKGPNVFEECDRYVASHPELFAGLLPQDARNRCFYLHEMGTINVKK